MAEISLDLDTNIRDLEDSNRTTTKSDSQKHTQASTSKSPKSVVVRISKEKLEKPSCSDEKAKASTSKNSSNSKSTSTTTVSSQKKKELLKKAQQVKEKLAKEKEKEKSLAPKSKPELAEKGKEPPIVPEPHPVPENFNIPRISQAEPPTPRSSSPSRGRDVNRGSPRRSRSPRASARGEGRGSSRSARSRSPRRSHSRSASRRRSRSPYYRRRRSPSRSRSRENFRPYYNRSPRRRSPSPFVRRRFSPPRVYRPRDRSVSRSPTRYGPPRWQRGDDRFSGPRDDGFLRGPPPRGGFNQPWGRGFHHPPEFSQGFSRGQSDFQGFSEHSEQWGLTPIPPSSQSIPVVRDQMPASNTQMLPLPPDVMTGNSAQQSMIDSLKEELKGLSKTMLSFTSQMGKATQSTPDVDKSADLPPPTDSTFTRPADVPVVQPVAPPSSDVSSLDTSVGSRSTNKMVSRPQVEDEEMDLSSESEGESSEGDSSSEDSDEDSDEDSMVKTVDGFLDWPSLTQLITEKFSDRISPEEANATVARIDNLGGLVEKKETERVRLPMFPAIKEELVLFSKDIRCPASKAKARRDTNPLGRGVFPEAQKGLSVQAMSEDLRFNQPAQIDAGIERLLPPKKSTFNVQGRFSDENLRKMERDLRVNLSSLSYSLWSLDYATQTLSQMEEKEKKKKRKAALIPCISACRHSLSFLTTVVDRSALALATTILARRDSYLSQVDNLLPEEDHVMLRSSSFLDTSLFAGSTSDLVPKLEGLRRESQSRESVDVLTSLAKKGVSGSSSQKTTAGSGFTKKKSKKHSKKKGSKKAAATSGTVTTTSDQPATGGIKRTFRNKGKKSTKK